MGACRVELSGAFLTYSQKQNKSNNNDYGKFPHPLVSYPSPTTYSRNQLTLLTMITLLSISPTFKKILPTLADRTLITIQTNINICSTE